LLLLILLSTAASIADAAPAKGCCSSCLGLLLLPTAASPVDSCCSYGCYSRQLLLLPLLVEENVAFVPRPIWSLRLEEKNFRGITRVTNIELKGEAMGGPLVSK
jgi:hypothetical protein